MKKLLINIYYFCDAVKNLYKHKMILFFFSKKYTENNMLDLKKKRQVLTFLCFSIEFSYLKISLAFTMFLRTFTPNGQLGSHFPHIIQSFAFVLSDR